MFSLRQQVLPDEAQGQQGRVREVPFSAACPAGVGNGRGNGHPQPDSTRRLRGPELRAACDTELLRGEPDLLAVRAVERCQVLNGGL